MADDILIYGKDQGEHDDNLRKFLKRVCECGLKLNKKKCRFHMTTTIHRAHPHVRRCETGSQESMCNQKHGSAQKLSGSETFPRTCELHG